ncbi:MAG: hypothetical protein Q9183_004319 [Haloplaca sp. 2 TL-2023]
MANIPTTTRKLASHPRRKDESGQMGKHNWVIFIVWTFAVVSLTVFAIAFQSTTLIYDQTILTKGIGMLVGRPPLRDTKTISTQETRIPRAPFRILILLNLLRGAIGTCLLVVALITVNQGRGVADVQARLSTPGVVAANFH